MTSDQPPEHVYWLEAVELQLGEPPAGDLPDFVVAVRAIPGLDTDRILVRGPGARLNHYAGARWPDHLPEIVTVAVRLALESSGRFNRVRSGSRMDRGIVIVAIPAGTVGQITLVRPGVLITVQAGPGGDIALVRHRVSIAIGFAVVGYTVVVAVNAGAGRDIANILNLVGVAVFVRLAFVRNAV